MKYKTYNVEILEHRKDGGRIMINTGSVDRDKDRVFPGGAKVENYLNNPVVQFAHNYRDPWATIGKTTHLEVSSVGITAEFELREPANENDTQQIIIRQLWNERWIRTASVGFNPDFEEVEFNEFGGLDFKSWELLEWSLVPVPANQDALRLMAKHIQDTSIVSRVIPFKRLPGKGIKKEVGNIDPSILESEDLFKASLIFDPADPQNKDAYQLIHHETEGEYRPSLESVKRCSAILSAAGLDIEEMKDAQDHLGRHWLEFGQIAPWDKQPQEWKAYDKSVREGDVDEIAQVLLFDKKYGFDGLHKSAMLEIDVLDTDAFVERMSEFFSEMATIAETGINVEITPDLALEASKEFREFLKKDGRVLSKTNENRIRTAYEKLGEVLEQMEDEEKEHLPIMTTSTTNSHPASSSSTTEWMTVTYPPQLDVDSLAAKVADLILEKQTPAPPSKDKDEDAEETPDDGANPHITPAQKDRLSELFESVKTTIGNI